VTGGHALTFKTRPKGATAVCAGAIGSAEIILRSGVKHANMGCGLTDHDIWGGHFFMDKHTPPMKIQAACMDCESNTPFLFNMCINSQSFLGRPINELLALQPAGPLQMCTATFQLQAQLIHSNKVTITTPCAGSSVQIERQDQDHIQPTADSMQACFCHIVKLIAGDFGAKHCGVKLEQAPLGSVAHEVGTLRMSKDATQAVVDANLLLSGYKNIYACDLSVMLLVWPWQLSILFLWEHIVAQQRPATILIVFLFSFQVI